MAPNTVTSNSADLSYAVSRRIRYLTDGHDYLLVEEGVPEDRWPAIPAVLQEIDAPLRDTEYEVMYILDDNGDLIVDVMFEEEYPRVQTYPERRFFAIVCFLPKDWAGRRVRRALVNPKLEVINGVV